MQWMESFNFVFRPFSVLVPPWSQSFERPQGGRWGSLLQIFSEVWKENFYMSPCSELLSSMVPPPLQEPSSTYLWELRCLWPITFLFFFFLDVLGLCCSTRAFSSCGERGLLFIAWASHCSGFSSCRARALGRRASVVVAHRLSSCGSRALERRLSSCGARA